MTDANGITISNIAVSANRWVPGETGTISFKFTNGSGMKIVELILSLGIREKQFTGEEDGYPIIVLQTIAGKFSPISEKVSLANGKSKTYASTFTITEETAQYFRDYPEIRRVTMCLRYSVTDSMNSGWFGTFDLPEMEVINCRFLPMVSNFTLVRAKDGAPNDEGESVLAALKLSLADTGYDYTRFMKARIYQSQMIEATLQDPYTDITDRIPELLAGVENDANLIPDVFSKSFSWYFLLVFGDEYETVYSAIYLDRSFANMHLSGLLTGGVCFGGFCTSTYGNPRLESYYPIRPYGGIEAVKGGVYTQELELDADAPFAVYEDNPLPPTLRVFGHVVEIQGEIKPTKTLTGGTTYRPICTLPAQYAPEHDLVVLQQGSGQSIWMLRIFNRNHPEYPCKAMFARYRSGASWAGADASTWLPFHAVWSIEGSVSGESTALEAVLQDAEGYAVQDANGSDVAVLSATGDAYQSRYTGDQIDAGIGLANTALQRSGGTMSGYLNLTQMPVEDSHAANKAYVDRKYGEIELIPGKSAFAYAQESGYTGTEDEFGADLYKAIQGGAVDAIAWGKITGKPFGNSITGSVAIDGESIIWDGNTEGMYIVGYWIYASPSIPTLEQVRTGCTCIYVNSAGKETERSLVAFEEGSNIISLNYDDGDMYHVFAVIVKEPGYTSYGTFERPGVYFTGFSTAYIGRLTISGYTWTESAEIAPIDEKYISTEIARQSAVDAVADDLDSMLLTTSGIAWNGEVHDREIATNISTTGQFVRVYNGAVTLDQLCAGGFTVLMQSGSIYSYTEEEAYAMVQELTSDGSVIGFQTPAGWIYVCNSVLGATVSGLISFPSRGVYFWSDGAGSYVQRLESEGINALTTETLIRADKLPIADGFIMRTPGGKRWKITIDADGEFVKTEL